MAEIGRTRVIGRQVEEGQGASQVPLPVAPQLLPFGAGQHRPLPAQMIGKGPGQGWQRCRCAAHFGGIQALEFLMQKRHRPAVNRHMMVEQEERVVVRCMAEEIDAHGQLLGEIKGAAPAGMDLLQQAFGRPPFASDQRQPNLRIVPHPLHPLAVPPFNRQP
jgi:hypothetical protein